MCTFDTSHVKINVHTTQLTCQCVLSVLRLELQIHGEASAGRANLKCNVMCSPVHNLVNLGMSIFKQKSV